LQLLYNLFLILKYTIIEYREKMELIVHMGP